MSVRTFQKIVTERSPSEHVDWESRLNVNRLSSKPGATLGPENRTKSNLLL